MKKAPIDMYLNIVFLFYRGVDRLGVSARDRRLKLAYVSEYLESQSKLTIASGGTPISSSIASTLNTKPPGPDTTTLTSKSNRTFQTQAEHGIVETRASTREFTAGLSGLLFAAITSKRALVGLWECNESDIFEGDPSWFRKDHKI